MAIGFREGTRSMRVGSGHSRTAARTWGRALVAVQAALVMVGCGGGSGGASDPAPVTWSRQDEAPMVVTITGGPWTLTQLAAGNPNPPSVPNQSFGYGANFPTANEGQTSAMQPFYFPFILGHGNNLQGYFDWRPKNINEAVVAAHSSDGGRSWQFDQIAMVLTRVLPRNPQSANPDPGIADDGFGHPSILHMSPPPLPSPVPGLPQPTPVYHRRSHMTFLYNTDRSKDANGKYGLVVSVLSPKNGEPLNGALADKPIVNGGFTDETKITRTTGLKNPDGFLAVVPRTFPLQVLYIQRIGNADATGSTMLPAGQRCGPQPYTPPGAASPYPANHDIAYVRIATTEDGINFTDHGIAYGLSDPTDTSYTGTRWVAPNGTLLDYGDGHYGLFFGAGNCMDADADAFHYIGYAENVTPFDLSNWNVLNDIMNPIVSTLPQTLPVNGVMTTIPAEDAVAGPVLPTHQARVYTPSASVIDSHTVALTFSGYGVYEPTDNLLNYRTIHTIRLRSSRPIPLDAKAE
jgi:hypothetical protein